MMQNKEPWLPYELIETPEFLIQMEAIIGDIRHWDNAKWSGNWALEKDPTAGQYILDDDSWALIFLTDPQIVVFYKVDEVLRQVTPVRVFLSDFLI